MYFFVLKEEIKVISIKSFPDTFPLVETTELTLLNFGSNNRNRNLLEKRSFSIIRVGPYVRNGYTFIFCSFSSDTLQELVFV